MREKDPDNKVKFPNDPGQQMAEPSRAEASRVKHARHGRNNPVTRR
jgi:hypothetical protein